MELLDGERIVYQAHPSWRATLGYYLKGLLLIVVIGAIVAGVSRIAEDEVKWAWVAIAVIVIAALMLLVGYLKRMATQYTISDRRIYVRRGLLSRHTEQTRIERVQDVTTSQSLLERILRVGTVDFDVASGEEGELFRFAGVAAPREVVRAVDEAHHAVGHTPGTQPPPSDGL